MDPTASPLPSQPVLAAVARLLRPLVRLLIRSGVTCPTVMDLIRGIYVDVAHEMVPDPKARTDSRISVMTGVHRKELRRHRTAEAPPPHSAPLGAQVAARWLGHPGLQDTNGAPLPLPRTAPDGEPSFEALVEAVTRDVRPRAVLDDWLEQDLVTHDAEGRLVLRAQAFLPRPGGAEQMFYLGRNLHDHLAAAAANVLPEPDGTPFLERSVHYDGLSAAAAARLAEVARDAAQRMLIDVNRTALAIADADDAAATGQSPAGPPRTHRVNLGAYLFEAKDGP